MKKGRAHRGRVASKKPKNSFAWIIPAVAVAVVAILVVGVILTANRQLDQSSSAQTGVATSQALATAEIPYPAVTRTSLQEATTRIDAGEAVLIDVRSRASYDASHAAGSLSFPEEEIEARLKELPDGKAWILV